MVILVGEEMKMTAPLKISTPLPHCSGSGKVHITPHWDSGHAEYDADCGGCSACAGPGFAVASFVYGAAHLGAVAGTVAFAALAAVGAAVASAGAPGAAVSAFVTGAVAAWNGPPVKGAWYEVTGKRGRAKEHVGKTGECFWIREEGYTRYGRTTYSTRVGLKGADGVAVFVPASCVSRVLPPAAALPAIAAKATAVAEKAARVPYLAARGEVVSVTHGFNAGKVGRVFWTGSGKAGARYGLDPEVNRKGRCPNPLWVDAVDCGPFVATPAPVKAPAPTVIPPAAPVLSEPAAPGVCSGVHTKFDGSYWVNDARGIPVARVCDRCKAAKLRKYRPEIFTNANYETTEAV